MLRGLQNWIEWRLFGTSILYLYLPPLSPPSSSWFLIHIWFVIVFLGIESSGLVFHGSFSDYGWYNYSSNMVNCVVLVPRSIGCAIWRLTGRFIFYFLFVSTQLGGNRTRLYPIFMHHTRHVIPIFVQSNEMYNK